MIRDKNAVSDTRSGGTKVSGSDYRQHHEESPAAWGRGKKGRPSQGVLMVGVSRKYHLAITTGGGKISQGRERE
jgi:hypothetical protein